MTVLHVWSEDNSERAGGGSSGGPASGDNDPERAVRPNDDTEGTVDDRETSSRGVEGRNPRLSADSVPGEESETTSEEDGVGSLTEGGGVASRSLDGSDVEDSGREEQRGGGFVGGGRRSFVGDGRGERLVFEATTGGGDKNIGEEGPWAVESGCGTCEDASATKGTTDGCPPLLAPSHLLSSLHSTLSTIRAMCQASGLCAHPVHYHSFQRFSGLASLSAKRKRCSGCQQQLQQRRRSKKSTATPEHATDMGEALRCISCGAYAHRKCALGLAEWAGDKCKTNGPLLDKCISLSDRSPPPSLPRRVGKVSCAGCLASSRRAVWQKLVCKCWYHPQFNLGMQRRRFLHSAKLQRYKTKTW